MITLTSPALPPLARSAASNFYGSSLVSGPYGRILVRAPRDEEAVLVADLDLDQRRPLVAGEPYGALHAATAVVR